MHPSWKPFLDSEFTKPYFKELSNFLKTAYETQTIYPPKTHVFSAFTTDLNNIKVIILGQDPYHGPGQAHGLAFSVRENVPPPPSLINIFKEIHDELDKPIPTSGNLTHWADQGVLLLNNTLTVEAHKAGSHRNHGWEIFTEAVVKYLNETRPHLVFLLWGRDARSKKPLINGSKHLILESAHPSPLSAHAGFFGNGHFLKTNTFLISVGENPINW
jgi:uracil-DNA glycosylase